MNVIKGRQIILDKIRSRGVTVEDAATSLGYGSKAGLYRLLKNPRKLTYEKAMGLAIAAGCDVKSIFRAYNIYL